MGKVGVELLRYNWEAISNFLRVFTLPPLPADVASQRNLSYWIFLTKTCETEIHFYWELHQVWYMVGIGIEKAEDWDVNEELLTLRTDVLELNFCLFTATLSNMLHTNFTKANSLSRRVERKCLHFWKGNWICWKMSYKWDPNSQ